MSARGHVTRRPSAIPSDVVPLTIAAVSSIRSPGINGAVNARLPAGLVRHGRADADDGIRSTPALRRLWSDPAVDEIEARDLAGDYAVVRYGTPDGFNVDLVSGEVFRFEDVQSEVLEVDGVPVRITTPRMLYRMKRDTLRPIDRADAADLKAKFGIEDG